MTKSDVVCVGPLTGLEGLINSYVFLVSFELVSQLNTKSIE